MIYILYYSSVKYSITTYQQQFDFIISIYLIYMILYILIFSEFFEKDTSSCSITSVICVSYFPSTYNNPRSKIIQNQIRRIIQENCQMNHKDSISIKKKQKTKAKNQNITKQDFTQLSQTKHSSNKIIDQDDRKVVIKIEDNGDDFYFFVPKIQKILIGYQNLLVVFFKYFRIALDYYNFMQKLDKAHFVIQGTYDEETQSCLICLQPITYPVQCQKCASLFCKKCANKWKKNNQKCPKKCSQNEWIFSTSKPFNILLRCPYQNSQCKSMSPQEFEDHYKICDKSPKQLKQLKTEEELKKLYLCKQGHKLSYIGTENRNKIFSTCAQCEQRRLSRSICLQCRQNQEQNIVYCCLCRNPPMKRSICPQQHKFKLRYDRLSSVTCDYCAKRVDSAGQYCYNDKICDYALCLTCFEQLPKQQNIIYEIEENVVQQFPVFFRRVD